MCHLSHPTAKIKASVLGMYLNVLIGSRFPTCLVKWSYEVTGELFVIVVMVTVLVVVMLIVVMIVVMLMLMVMAVEMVMFMVMAMLTVVRAMIVVIV